MLTLKVNKKDIEITEREGFVRGTVGAECRVIFDYSAWYQDFHTVTVVFKRYDGKPINILAREMEQVITIPHEILATSGSFRIGVFGVAENIVTPTLWSDEIKVEYGTETNGTAPEEYTPTEIEQIKTELDKNKIEIDKKQDKLTAGKNITIDDNNVISTTGGSTAVNEDQFIKRPFEPPVEDLFTRYKIPVVYNIEEMPYNVPRYLPVEYWSVDNDRDLGSIPKRSSRGIAVYNTGVLLDESTTQELMNEEPMLENFKKKCQTASIGGLQAAMQILRNETDEKLSFSFKDKEVTSIFLNYKYEFEPNALYFLKSGSGKADITILNSDGQNIIGSLKSSYCLLIMPKKTYARSEWTAGYSPNNPRYDGKVYVDGNREENYIRGLFAGMTDKTAIVPTDKLQMLQFDLINNQTVSVTPATSDGIMCYKIKL